MIVVSGLWLKARGITVRVAELCALLEEKICSLLQDLACLCPDQEVDTTLLAISHTLKAHQQALCSDLLSRYSCITHTHQNLVYLETGRSDPDGSTLGKTDLHSFCDGNSIVQSTFTTKLFTEKCLMNTSLM